MQTSSNKGQWTALWVSFITVITIFIPYVGYSTMLPQIMEDMSINYTNAGLLASFAPLAGGIILPFAGAMVNRWGAKNVTLIGLLICSIGLVMFAYMPTFNLLLFSRMILGMGFVLLFVAPYTIVVRWFKNSDKLGISLGVMVATDGIGTLVALYFYSLILNEFGWRHGSAIGGLFVFIMCIITAVSLKEAPDVENNEKSNSKIEKFNFKEYISVFGKRNIIIACCYGIGHNGSFNLAVIWVPTLLIEDAGWTEGGAGFVGALFPLAGVISAIVFGMISDRIGRRKPILLIAGFLMMISYIGLTLAQGFNQHILLAVLLTLTGFFAYGGLPISYSLMADTVGAKTYPIAHGFVLTSAFLVGGFVYPLAIGFIKDLTSLYTVGFIAVSISVLILNFLVPLMAREMKSPSVKKLNVEGMHTELKQNSQLS